jgi:HSP20 family molecular chaperone IbpA
MTHGETPPASVPAPVPEPPPVSEPSRTPPPRRAERLHLFLAGLVGALTTAVVFLSILLLRSDPPASPSRPEAGEAASGPSAVAPDPGRPGSPVGQGLQDLMRGMQRRMQNLSSGGGFTLRLGGDDVDLQLQEEADAVIVVARVKDAVADKFNVQVNGRLFSLTGERRLGSGGFKGTVSFSQSLTLPADVDSTGMTSEFKDGVLRVRLPKRP